MSSLPILLRALSRVFRLGLVPGLRQPHPQHRLRLFGHAVRVLALDHVDLRRGETQLRRQRHPILAQEVAHVGQSRIRPVVVEVLELLQRVGVSQGDGVDDDVVGQDDVQYADRLLGRLALRQLGFAHEQAPTHGLGVLVLHSHRERETVLPECPKRELELFTALGDRHQVAGELDVLGLALEDLHVAAFRHFGEVLLMFEGLVFFVVRHAEDAQAGLQGVDALRKHHEFRHERDVDGLPERNSICTLCF
jgi:hypothetical protein